MKNFWDWYDGLQQTRPALRFALFMLLAIVLLMFLPVGFWIAGSSMMMGQFVGLAIMGILAFAKTRR